MIALAWLIGLILLTWWAFRGDPKKAEDPIFTAGLWTALVVAWSMILKVLIIKIKGD